MILEMIMNKIGKPITMAYRLGREEIRT